MKLTRGTRLGPYEIVTVLGAGGMGEVYRARDPRLHRDVAIKVLASTPDAASLQRFEQEAQAAAGLNHPNILVIYDFGSHNDQPFVVSELLEGETLRETLSRGPLSVKRTLDYAGQIAVGLAAAHWKGIVHRDLKPANLFVTTDGRVKILDFGLAVLVDPREAIQNWSTVSTSKLARAAGTIGGGTVNYMSPEQIRGEAIDNRSDIFSFGVVLYEMLTGRHAFDRGSPIETMSAAATSDPDGMAELLPRLPRQLQLVLQRCLEKHPDDRFQSTRDLSFALTLVDDSVHASAREVAANAGKQLPRRAVLVALLGILAIAASFIAGTRLAHNSPPTYQQLTFRRGTIQSARFAGDGHTVVYSAAWDGGAAQMYATRPGSPESRPLPLATADILAISQSGEMAVLLGRRNSFGVGTGGTLARLPLDGSAPREVLTGVEEADWAPDGESLAVTHIVQGRYRLEYPIGNVLYETSGRINQIRISRDGARVAFVDHAIFDDDRGVVCVISRGGGAKQVLSQEWSSVSGLAWSSSGDEIWFTAATLGAAASLYAVDLAGKVRPLAPSPSRMTIQDVDRAGRVLLTESRFRVRIGAVESRSGAQRDLTWLDGSVVTDVSADGQMLLINEQAAGGGTPLYAVYVRKVDGSPAIRIGDGSTPALSPDGRWAAAVLLRSPPSLALLPTGVGQPRTLNTGTLAGYQAVTWFPDGRRLLLAANEGGRSTRLWTLDVPDGVPKPASPEGFRIPSFGRPVSPDGLQVATFDATGRLWLLPLSGSRPARSIHNLETSMLPIGWSSDGRWLYVFQDGSLPATVYRFNVADHRTERVTVLAPQDLAGVTPPATIVASRDGSRFFYTYVQNLSDLFLVDNLR